MRHVLALAAQQVEPQIVANYRPRDGLVIVSGPTHSGRSTLVAGMTAAKLEDPERDFHIVEGATPVEFLFDHVPGASSTILQSEIPRDLPSTAAFVRGSLRREPTDIVVGECRDGETLGAAIQAATSGIAVTTTLHANGVVSTMQRVVALCSAEKGDSLVSKLAQSLRLIISQRLAPSTDGRRTPLREFLVFDPVLRAEFLRRHPAEWVALTSAAVADRGQTFRKAVEKALQAGRISEETAAYEMGGIG